MNDNLYIGNLKYYDKTGKQITPEEWKNLLNDIEYRHIEKYMTTDYLISTIWLGIETRIFESIIFTKKLEDKFTGWEEKYQTLEEAIKGHQILVDMIKNYTGGKGGSPGGGVNEGFSIGSVGPTNVNSPPCI